MFSEIPQDGGLQKPTVHDRGRFWIFCAAAQWEEKNMKDRQRRLFLVICALLGMLVLTFAGCKKKPQDEQPELPDSGE